LAKPTLDRTFQIVPLAALVWMMFGAARVFAPDVGRRDFRGLGIALSMWGTLAATRVARVPPRLMQWIGACGLLLSLALFQWAAASIRGRTFSFAGNNDLPQFVHSSGPYAYVRNPFYLSYLLAETATLIMWPSIWGGVIVVVMIAYFQWLARFEEEKFARSPVAAEYAAYKAATGRLWPRLNASSRRGGR
jgi:protein-S-isoprenylcysteine O-methyltransferase Ste14